MDIIIEKRNRKASLIIFCTLFLIGMMPLSASAAEVHWCYDGSLECGPDHWGTLSSEFHMCKDGTQQSPVELYRHVNSATLSAINFNYSGTPLKVKNNGHTIQVDYAPGSTATIGGQTYNLLQFHFHSRSEHTRRGRTYDMELHLVHMNDFGQLAVVGVLLTEGNYNSAIQRLWDVMPTQVGVNEVLGSQINVSDLLPSRRDYYHYSGSLTTPPCSEGVNWNVFEYPIQVSAGQLAQFRAIAISDPEGDIVFDNINRPVQPLNGRVIQEYTAGH